MQLFPPCASLLSQLVHACLGVRLETEGLLLRRTARIRPQELELQVPFDLLRQRRKSSGPNQNVSQHPVEIGEEPVHSSTVHRECL